MNDDLVAIARIARPRGIRGEAVADVLTDFPERFALTESVIAVSPEGRRRELTIESHAFQKGRIVLKFAGIDTPEAAEELRGSEICVPETESVELEEDEYFDWMLAGCVVRLTDGTELGSVREVMRTGGTEILVVAGAAKEYLIPFAKEICVAVDTDGHSITVDPPEGLLEF